VHYVVHRLRSWTWRRLPARAWASSVSWISR